MVISVSNAVVVGFAFFDSAVVGAATINCGPFLLRWWRRILRHNLDARVLRAHQVAFRFKKRKATFVAMGREGIRSYGREILQDMSSSRNHGHAEDVDLQRQALDELRALHISTGFMFDADNILVREGIDGVQKALQIHASDIEVQRLGLLFLEVLAEKKDRAGDIFASGAVNAVLEALQKHISDVEVQRRGLSALVQVAANGDEKIAMSIAGGVDAVLETLRAHATDVVVQRRGLQLLTLQCRGLQALAQRLHFADEQIGVLTIGMKLMKKLESDDESLRTTWWNLLRQLQPSIINSPIGFSSLLPDWRDVRPSIFLRDGKLWRCDFVRVIRSGKTIGYYSKRLMASRIFGRLDPVGIIRNVGPFPIFDRAIARGFVHGCNREVAVKIIWCGEECSA